MLQDALYVRPEMREWGIRVSDDRNEADIYIDVTTQVNGRLSGLMAAQAVASTLP